MTATTNRPFVPCGQFETKREAQEKCKTLSSENETWHVAPNRIKFTIKRENGNIEDVQGYAIVRTA